MRDIKFRGKTTKKSNLKHAFNEIWCYGDLITTKHKYFIHPKNNVFKNENELSRLMITHEIDKNTLGQYTGLKDKNGKEIYEGDIIHIHHKFFEEFNYVLKWNEEYLRYYLYSTDEKNLNSIGGILEAHLGTMINEIEVIGNIFDNPDLLEKGAEE